MDRRSGLRRSRCPLSVLAGPRLQSGRVFAGRPSGRRPSGRGRRMVWLHDAVRADPARVRARRHRLPRHPRRRIFARTEAGRRCRRGTSDLGHGENAHPGPRARRHCAGGGRRRRDRRRVIRPDRDDRARRGCRASSLPRRRTAPVGAPAFSRFAAWRRRGPHRVRRALRHPRHPSETLLTKRSLSSRPSIVPEPSCSAAATSFCPYFRPQW